MITYVRLGLATVAVAAALSACGSAQPAARQSPLAATGTTSVTADQPSAAAAMVCNAKLHQAIATVLGLPADPPSTSSWLDHRYTCTYRLTAGPLVISAQESPDLPAAQAYLVGLLEHVGRVRQLSGVEALGQTAYETPTGQVIVLKDATTLHVDATRLAAPLGPNRLSAADLAYEIATDILACWTGH